MVTMTQDNPGALMLRATDVAGVCAEIVKRTAMSIQGKKYVRVEGWQSIAAAYGCVASAKDVRHIENGVEAIGELRRISDGAILATAVGFVGKDEPTWFGGETTDRYGKKRTLPKRPDFAIQAMAQTRAISRVTRGAFAFVVVLIDGNLSTTPAEEMMGAVIQHDEQPPADRLKVAPDQIEALKAALKESGMELATLLAKAELTDLSDMASDDAMNAILWIKKQAKAKK